MPEPSGVLQLPDRPPDPENIQVAGFQEPDEPVVTVSLGKDGGPVDSLHYESFMEAMQDLRLLQELESRIGRKAVVKLIHAGLAYEIRMDRFPHSAEYLEKLHAAILRKLDRADA